MKTAILRSALSVVTIYGFTPVIATPADQKPGTGFLSQGRDESRSDYYPVALLSRGVEGRILLELERSTDGRLRILSMEVSNPPDAFDKATSMTIANFRCSKIAAPIVACMSITFSIAPEPGFPNFDGVDAEIGIQGSWTRSRDDR